MRPRGQASPTHGNIIGPITSGTNRLRYPEPAAAPLAVLGIKYRSWHETRDALVRVGGAYTMYVLATRSKDTGAVPSGKTVVRLTCTSLLLVLLALLVPCQGMPLPHVCSWHGGSNWRQARPAARHHTLLS